MAGLADALIVTTKSRELKTRAPAERPDSFWREAAIAASFANLCFFHVWWNLLALKKGQELFQAAPMGPAHAWAAILNVLVAGGLMLAALRMARPSGSRAVRTGARIALLFLLLIPLNAIRQCVPGSGFLAHPRNMLPLLSFWQRVLAVAISGGIVWGVWRFRSHVERSLRTVLFCLFPVFPIFAIQGIWKAAPANATYPALTRPYAVPASAAPAHWTRVVWIIFDEWSYSLMFADRDGIGERGEVGKIVAESLFADQAFPPGPRTAISIPALFAGRLAAASYPVGPSELMVRFEGSAKAEPWGAQDNVLAGFHARGVRTRLVGWWLPYSRIFGSVAKASECQVQSISEDRATFPQIGADQFRSLFETLAFSPLGQSLATERFRDCFAFNTSEAIAAAADPAFDLVVLHLTGAHKPFFYDAKTGTNTLRNSPNSAYFDALKLVDRTAGELRTAMQRAGVWDSSAVILSSDHWFRDYAQIRRPLDRRVPFVFKPARGGARVNYSRPFNTVLTRGLVEAAAEGRVDSAASAAQWIDEHRGSMGPSQYYNP